MIDNKTTFRCPFAKTVCKDYGFIDTCILYKVHIGKHIFDGLCTNQNGIINWVEKIIYGGCFRSAGVI